MKIVEVINKDEEIRKLKSDYKEKYNKNAPPFNYDQYGSIEEYKEKLKTLVEKPSSK